MKYRKAAKVAQWGGIAGHFGDGAKPIPMPVCVDCRTFKSVCTLWCSKVRRYVYVCHLCAHDRTHHPRGGKCRHTAEDIYPAWFRRELAEKAEAYAIALREKLAAARAVPSGGAQSRSRRSRRVIAPAPKRRTRRVN